MKRRSRSVIALVGVLLGCTLCAAPAVAGLTPPVADCNQHATLTHSYSVLALRTALNTMPADVQEYTDCYDVIQRALLAQLGHQHSSGSGGGGGSFLPTPVVIVLILLGLSGVSFAVMVLTRRRNA